MSFGDLVDVFVLTSGQKRETPCILSFNRTSWTITVPASNGRTMQAAIGDVRDSIYDLSFACLFRAANDLLEAELTAAYDDPVVVPAPPVVLATAV